MTDGFIARKRLSAHPVEDVGYGSRTNFYAIKVFDDAGQAFERNALYLTEISHSLYPGKI